MAVGLAQDTATGAKVRTLPGSVPCLMKRWTGQYVSRHRRKINERVEPIGRTRKSPADRVTVSSPAYREKTKGR